MDQSGRRQSREQVVRDLNLLAEEGGIETIKIGSGADEVAALVKDLYEDLPGQVAAITQAVERWVEHGGGGDFPAAPSSQDDTELPASECVAGRKLLGLSSRRAFRLRSRAFMLGGRPPPIILNKRRGWRRAPLGAASRRHPGFYLVL